jgi:hypothetical protein
MSEIELFRVVLSLRSALSSMAVKITEQIDEKAVLQKRIKELEDACELVRNFDSTDFHDVNEVIDALEKIIERIRTVLPKKGKDA